MIFQFHKGDELLSRLIGIISFGNYNHVSIVSGKFVYEAHIKSGVTKTPIKKYDMSSVAEKIEVKSRRELVVSKWLDKQVGKKYDILGVLSFLSILTKPRKGYWFCSEIAMVTYSKLKGSDIDMENQKVSPQLFYDIIKLN